MNRIASFLLISLIASTPLLAQADYDTCIFKISKQQIINELARYSEHWKNDSLANNGFRLLFGREFFRCTAKSFEGTQWSTISDYLGKPHFVFKDNKNFVYAKNEILYRYVLFTYGDYRDFKDIGNTILDIFVVNGLVRSLVVYEIDG